MKKSVPMIAIFALLVWLLTQGFILKPEIFFISLSISSLLIIFLTRKLGRIRGDIFWPKLAINPLLVYLSAAFYSAILISQIWIQIILAIAVGLMFYYFKNIYYFFSFGAPEREIKLRRLIAISSFLSFFWTAAVLYSLPIFLNLSFLTIFSFLLIISLIFLGQLDIFKIRYRQNIIFWPIESLVLGQLAGVLLLLPLGYNVRALILAIIFYILALLGDWRHESCLTKRKLQWLSSIGFIIIFIILFFARWR